jgi:hypothetical protein
MALLGSIAALLTLTRWHDAQLAGLAQPLHPRRDQG